MTAEKTTVLHLRATSGGGGGPDKTILKTALQIDTDRFEYLVACLRRSNRDLAPIMSRAKAASLPYWEFPGRPFWDGAQLRSVAALARKRNVRILHAHDPKTDLYGLALRRMIPGVKLMSTMHGWLTGTRRLFSNRLDLWALRRYDLVLAVSRHTEEIARRVGGLKNTTVLYNAIDTDEWSRDALAEAGAPVPKKENGALLVGFVGRLSVEKGPLEFIEVAARIARERPNVAFVIAGDGALKQEVALRIERLGLLDRFRMTGFLEADALKALYGCMDLVVSSSRTEGLPNNLLEAGAMGVPVVATRVGGVGEVITHGENGLLTERGDVAGLSELSLRLLEDSSLREQMATRARQVIEERFSMTARTRRLESFYDQLLAPPSDASGGPA